MPPDHPQSIERPLRIALLAHSTNPRGGVVHALELAEALHAAGHHVAVHAPDATGAGFFRATPFETVLVPAQLVSGGLAELVQQRIDEYVAYFTRAGTREWDILHAQDSISANALAVLCEQGIARGFTRTVHHIDSFADPRVMAYQKRGIVAASRVLCVSGTWREILRRDHGIEALQVPNGVNAQRFTPLVDATDERVRARYGLSSAGPVLLAVGGVEARKNTVRLLQAFVLFRSSHPQAQLVIGGGASLLDHGAYRAQFDAALRASGLETGTGKAIVLTGPVPDEDMPALYRCADALVFPSVKEGFGLVVLEAMACETPAVVSRIAPFTEYLSGGDCAWADPVDVGSIAIAMEAACNPESASALRRAGRAVCERFTWAASAQRHLEIYRTSVDAPVETAHA